MTRAGAIAAASIWLALAGGGALAVSPSERLADPMLEARARALSAELRCLVCQNQSIDDSDAPLARDLRLLVRERISAGDSDAAVKNFLVARYGDFVLLRPPIQVQTAVLWLMPIVGIIFGAMVIRRTLKSSVIGLGAASTSELTPSEQRRLDRMTGAAD